MPALDKLIWQIETDLHKNLTLTALSDRCAISTHHMCRLFQLATGLSIMSYVRARRLSEAAKTIVRYDADILTVALGAGYGSHEAFTRAFANYFNILPSIVRKARSTSSLDLMEPFKMKKDMFVEVQAPEIRYRDAFMVVGLSTPCSLENNGSIPALWQAFNARENEVEAAVSGAAYGVCSVADDAGNCTYLAGLKALKKTPGMDYVEVPAQSYAVFAHNGHISDLPKTVYTIWNKTLPDAGFKTAHSPDFEMYDRRFDPQTGRGMVEIWIPVVT
ncbi:AraC family transcriptional regulator [Agrobacterium arsenijevicii]|uniref:AraC family transcriptional regulator n=1 Tax=Agrobacterium arsenijevicii TaxID=1585697 RepID=A0ABR5D2M3_9HYPH|nr:AraC family transcriptional regulator [Agrobacterium arsenijevicii]